MTVPRHLEEAAARLQEAEAHWSARESPHSFENQRVWLEALTAYCKALGWSDGIEEISVVALGGRETVDGMKVIPNRRSVCPSILMTVAA
jgi:hypothetical protein